MIGPAWPLLRAAFFGLDAERAHELTLAALEHAPLPPARPDDPRLAVEAFGLRFPNPIGLAAGFDKNARVPHAMLKLGFGFAEVGSITPRPQEGNPKPRVFRLPQDEGVINRLGFNNEGQGPARERLGRRRPGAGIIGVNIGANKDSADRAADYAGLVPVFAPVADYLTVNISSPNTPGLRDMQARGALDDLLARVIAARDAQPARRPVLLKLAPDLALQDLDDAVEVALARGIDGLIVSNTTITRPAGLIDPNAKETGGLSGRPLFRRATWMLAEAACRVEGRVPLVGVGGIASPDAALIKIRAGASLLQLYSGLVYRGPSLVREIKAGLCEALGREKLDSLAPLVGVDRQAIAAEGPGG